MKILVAAAISLFLNCIPVLAADLDPYNEGALKDGPYASGFTWEGMYIGGSAGYTWGKTTATDMLATNNKAWLIAGHRFDADTSGGALSGYIGRNWQSGNLVWGLEGEVGWLGANGLGTYSSVVTSTHDKSDGGVFVTARGRLGWAFDRTLVYGTGGYIGADLNSNVYDHSQLFATSDAGFQSGWTVGGGVERALAEGWSLKAEYLYYDLGSEKVGGLCCGGGVTQFFNIDNTGNVVRLGLAKHW